jgi:hypothetical protein
MLLYQVLNKFLRAQFQGVGDSVAGGGSTGIVSIDCELLLISNTVR